MDGQMTLFPMDGIKKKINKAKKDKRNWENAFQKWSDKHGMDESNATSCGCCGYGSMCDYCKANDYGRPCVRALNEMSRKKVIFIDYSNRSEEYFEEVWYGK